MNLRTTLSIASLVVGAGAVGTASAQADPDLPRTEAVTIEVGAAAGERWVLRHDTPPLARLRAADLDGAGPVQLRWGIDLRRGAADTVQPFVGLGLTAGPRTTLYVEQGVPENPAALPLQAAPVADTRLGLEFRTGSKDSAWRQFGTLRMQVGLNSRLSLKPRRGGATISWHTRF